MIVRTAEEARAWRAQLEKALPAVPDKDASGCVDLYPTLKQGCSLIKAGTRINWGGWLKQATVDLWDTEENDPDHAPSWVKVFFKYEPDNVMERIVPQLEQIIEDLSNSRDRTIINHLSQYPVMSERAHTRPFERKWLNIVAAAVIPLGFVLYMRMWRYRLRLQRDLKVVQAENKVIIRRIEDILSRQ